MTTLCDEVMSPKRHFAERLRCRKYLKINQTTHSIHETMIQKRIAKLLSYRHQIAMQIILYRNIYIASSTMIIREATLKGGAMSSLEKIYKDYQKRQQELYEIRMVGEKQRREFSDFLKNRNERLRKDYVEIRVDW